MPTRTTTTSRSRNRIDLLNPGVRTFGAARKCRALPKTRRVCLVHPRLLAVKVHLDTVTVVKALENMQWCTCNGPFLVAIEKHTSLPLLK